MNSLPYILSLRGPQPEAIPKGDAVSRFYEIFQLKRSLPRRQRAPRKYVGAGKRWLATTSNYEMYGRGDMNKRRVKNTRLLFMGK
jgi:hypothetical protein